MLGVFGEGLVGGGGGGDDLVVHVGDVHDVQELKAAMAQMSPQHVLEREGPQISDVDVVVDGRPTGVHAHRVAFGGLEGLEGAGEGVIEVERH